MFFEKIVGHKVDKSASELTQHNNIHKWSRVDEGVKCFVMTKSGSPKCHQITRRQTYNSVNGKLLEDIIITPKTTNQFLHIKLPPGVTNIKTVFHHYSKPTTRGHHFRVLWKDGTHEWIPLRDMKEAFPVETAEYAIKHHLSNLPAFSWWIPHTMKKRDKIISAIRHRIVKKSYKYDHQVPSSVAEAYELDQESRTTRWQDAISKEMKNVMIVF